MRTPNAGRNLASWITVAVVVGGIFVSVGYTLGQIDRLDERVRIQEESIRTVRQEIEQSVLRQIQPELVRLSEQMLALRERVDDGFRRIERQLNAAEGAARP